MQQNEHTILYKHSKEVRFSKDFQLAEEIAKETSSQNNLPCDLKQNDNETRLFDSGNTAQFNDLQREVSEPIFDSICVDASTIENPGPTEYRGVDTRTGEILFQHKYDEATNNIGEFLAIVHALALYKKQGRELKIIYSDSLNAISWIKQKKCRTKYEKTAKNVKLFDDIKRAVAWLEANSFDTQILKWDTEAWGEIPADYGRK